jgi:hypothetical protein
VGFGGHGRFAPNCAAREETHKGADTQEQFFTLFGILTLRADVPARASPNRECIYGQRLTPLEQVIFSPLLKNVDTNSPYI